MTIVELETYGFNKNVIAAMMLLTKEDDVSYEDYISTISINPLATQVKIADLRHNLNLTRIPKEKQTEKFLNKYKVYEKSLNFLLKEQKNTCNLKKSSN